MKNRLLFIDSLRILGIALIVLEHVSSTNLYPWIWEYYPRFDILGLYNGNYGTIGVSIFLFASGLSLAVSYGDISTKEQLVDFYKKRLVRIYPPYWMAVLFAVVMDPNVIHIHFSMIALLRVVTGFQSLGATTQAEFYGVINSSLWFISLILSLYILAPIVIYAMHRHPHISIVSLLVIAIASSYYFGSGVGSDLSFGSIFWGGNHWFPLSRIFEFGFGMYLIRTGLYPKTSSNIVVACLGNLSFYIYLVHVPLLYLLSASFILFVIAVLFVSSMFYTFDNKIHQLWRK